MYPEPSKPAILRTHPPLYRFKPFHWRVQWSLRLQQTDFKRAICTCFFLEGSNTSHSRRLYIIISATYVIQPNVLITLVSWNVWSQKRKEIDDRLIFMFVCLASQVFVTLRKVVSHKDAAGWSMAPKYWFTGFSMDLIFTYSTATNPLWPILLRGKALCVWAFRHPIICCRGAMWGLLHLEKVLEGPEQLSIP